MHSVCDPENLDDRRLLLSHQPLKGQLSSFRLSAVDCEVRFDDRKMHLVIEGKLLLFGKTEFSSENFFLEKLNLLRKILLEKLKVLRKILFSQKKKKFVPRQQNIWLRTSNHL